MSTLSALEILWLGVCTVDCTLYRGMMTYTRCVRIAIEFIRTIAALQKRFSMNLFKVFKKKFVFPP